MVKSRAKQILMLVLTVCMIITFMPVTNASAYPLDYQPVDSEVISIDELVNSAKTDADEAEPDADEEVRVIITLSEGSLTEVGFSTLNLAQNDAAMAYSEKLKDDQMDMVTKIENVALGGTELNVLDQFTITVNAISATVLYGQMEKIAAVDGVEGVYLDVLYELDPPVEDPNTATSGEMVGSYSAWADGYTGAGSRVAIIDTGIDRDHDSFNEGAFFYGLARSAAQFGHSMEDYDLLTVEDVAALLPKLHVGGSDYLKLTEASAEEVLAAAQELYTSAKIPFGFDYVFGYKDYNCDASSGDHGCHVSGIAAANTYIAAKDDDNDVYYTTQANGVTGIAPDAQILTMKVFSNGYGAYETHYMAAIEDAIMLGCDSINLSLGSSNAGRSYSTTYAPLLSSLTGTDTVITMSAGNNGAWADNEVNGIGLIKTSDVRTHTGGSPGSYTNSFTIASVTNIGMTGIMGVFNGVSVVPNDTASSYNAKTFDTLDVSEDLSGTEYEYVFIGDPDSGAGIYGDDGDFEGLDLTGKVALISRGGGVSFYVKANNAVKAGAAATVVYNNVDGTINMNLTGYEYTAPCVNISKAEADAILAASEKGENSVYSGTVKVIGRCNTIVNAEEGYNPSSFSSWGTTENLALKPEITAPGGNIYSTLDGNTYGNNSGTSMSAPSVTGAAAVVAQYIKENGLDEQTGLNVRTLAISLLMSTSAVLVDDSVDLPYSPRLQGSGLAQVYQAVSSPAYLLVGETAGNDGKVKMEFGDDPARSGVFADTFTINNLTDEPLSYSLDSIVTTMAVETINGEEYTSKSVYELEPEVSFVSAAESSYVYDLNSDGSVSWEDAMALLKTANGTAAALSDAQVRLYDLNGDDAITTADAQLLLAAINGDDSVINAFAEAYTVPAGGSIQVAMTIALSTEDKAYLEQHFENGCYIEGYVYVNSEMGDSRQMSIPMLGFYGNWTDPSMFSSVVMLEDAYSENKNSYTSNTGYENYFTVRYSGSTSEYYFSANPYVNDDEYIADRNAISTKSTLYKSYASLIRNADNLTYTIADAETGTVYYTNSTGTGTGAYYYSSNSAWSGLTSSATLSWTVNDALGTKRKLAEDTRIIITCRATPEYYWSREAQTVTGELGDGAYWYTTMTVDNTAPEVTAVNYNLEAVSGTRTVSVSVVDNRYTAAVLLLSKEGTVLARGAVNQTELGAEETIVFDLSEIYTNNFYIMVADYAGNSKTYEVNFGGTVETPSANAVLDAMFPATSGFVFGKLDTDDLSGFTTTMEKGIETSMLCAARAGDGTLYVASQEMDGNTLYSTLYKVDETNYTIAAVGERMEGGCTDMAWSPSHNVMFATYGPYLLVVDVANGSVIGAWTMSSYIGGSSSYGVGLAYTGTATNATYGAVDIYTLLATNGGVYQLGVAMSNGEYVLMQPSQVGTVTGVSASSIAGSGMYYADGLLYISAFDGTNTNLKFADLTLSVFQTFDIGVIPTAPISVYGAAAKSADASGAAAIAAMSGEVIPMEAADSIQPLEAAGLLG